MNRSLNLPQIQRIMNEFEKESSTMDMKEEMMSDAVDDAMEAEDEGEGEEMEGDKILKEVLDEIGMNMNEAVRLIPLIYIEDTGLFRLSALWGIGQRVTRHAYNMYDTGTDGQLVSAPTANPLANEPVANSRVAVAEGLASSPAAPGAGAGGAAGGGPMSRDEEDLQKRLDALRRD